MRRQLYMLLLAGGMVAAGPLGMTHALFTDSEAVDANTFTAGTVTLGATPSTALITFSTMAPGDTVRSSIVVSNSGNLALRYAISSSATNETPTPKNLKDGLVLTIKTIDVTTPGTPCDNFDGTQLYTGDLDSTAGKLVGDSATGSQTGDRTLAVSASETLCFKVDLPTAAADALQGATTTATFTFAAEQTKNN
jgi:predicted ribosomally synthesized peptide with SipW-like signal peptide